MSQWRIDRSLYRCSSHTKECTSIAFWTGAWALLYFCLLVSIQLSLGPTSGPPYVLAIPYLLLEGQQAQTETVLL